MSDERGEYGNEENVSLLPPTEHRGDYGRGSCLTGGEYSSIGTAEIVGGSNISNQKRRELCAVDADTNYRSDTYYQNPEYHQEYSNGGTNSNSDCGDSTIKNGGLVNF